MGDRADAGLRAFLRGPLSVRRDMMLCQQDLAELERRARSITPHGDGTPGGSGDPHKDGTLIALADKSAELDRLAREELPRMEKEVNDFLKKIGNDVYRTILHLRYVNGFSWNKVQDRMEEIGMSYGDRYILSLHRQALEVARGLWEEREQDAD